MTNARYSLCRPDKRSSVGITDLKKSHGKFDRHKWLCPVACHFRLCRLFHQFQKIRIAKRIHGIVLL